MSDLPPRTIQITRTLVVSGALASRDFERVHHDAQIATDSGAKDIFLNILTTQGLIGSAIGEWFGSGARISAMKLRLGMPAYPGDTLTLSGSLDGSTVSIEGALASGGNHVTGTVEVTLP